MIELVKLPTERRSAPAFFLTASPESRVAWIVAESPELIESTKVLDANDRENGRIFLGEGCRGPKQSVFRVPSLVFALVRVQIHRGFGLLDKPPNSAKSARDAPVTHASETVA